MPRVLPGERLRWAALAFLLFANAMVVESNDVVATSGFVSRVGAQQILWVWAADMLIVILAAGAYSLVVDRARRERLLTVLLCGFGLAYACLYILFRLGAPAWLSYSVLTLVNDQQWILFPMLTWALASDLFSVAEAKRLFPLLGGVAFAGGIAGNALTALVARQLSGSALGSVHLLLANSLLLFAMAFAFAWAARRLQVSARQSRQGERALDSLREGLAFVREVPSFRYLSLAMVLLGMSLNAIEYHLIATASQAYAQAPSLTAFYATVRAARLVLMLLVQGVVAQWLLQRLGLKSVFAVMPLALLAGLLTAFAWLGLAGAVVGECLARTTLQGVDEPARRAFLGLVPDERRGRVSAFVDGYLYALGSLVSCGLVGAIVAASGRLLSPATGRALYLGLSVACALSALWAIHRFRRVYDASMLNWRLRRRQRKSVLAELDL